MESQKRLRLILVAAVLVAAPALAGATAPRYTSAAEPAALHVPSLAEIEATQARVRALQAQGTARLDEAVTTLHQAEAAGMDPEVAGVLETSLNQVRLLLASVASPADASRALAAAGTGVKQVADAVSQMQQEQRAAGSRAHDEDAHAAGDLAKLSQDLNQLLSQASDEVNTAEAVQAQQSQSGQARLSSLLARAGGARARLATIQARRAQAVSYQAALELYGEAALAEAQAAAELTAVAPVKLVTVSLSEQVVRAFDGGHEILWTLATTGRPGLETDPGTYHIYGKYHPFLMRSPWPTSSPYWYPDTWVGYAMFFNGGDALHDAPWRYEYGPGSNFGLGGEPGTHGCVNIPLNATIALWNWTDVGTQVTVY